MITCLITGKRFPSEFRTFAISKIFINHVRTASLGVEISHVLVVSWYRGPICVVFLLLLRRGKARIIWPCGYPELPQGNRRRNRQCSPRRSPFGRSRLGSPRSAARPSAPPDRRCDPRQSPSRRPAFRSPSAECPNSTKLTRQRRGYCARRRRRGYRGLARRSPAARRDARLRPRARR